MIFIDLITLYWQVEFKSLLIFIDLLFLTNIIFAILILFFERKNSSSTLVWLMVLFFFPGIGFLAYLFLGQNLRKKRLFSLKEVADEYQRNLDTQQEKLLNNRLTFEDKNLKRYKDLIHLNFYSDKSIFYEGNDVKIFVDGKEKFDDLLEKINNANDYIHLQYYIFRNDEIGKEVLKLLEKKASEGIEVKFIYDAIGGIALPRYIFDQLIKNGGQVECFSPLFTSYFNLKINYRNHRKICVVDGKYAFLGGFNIGDEYLGRNKKMGYWRDTHLRVSGQAVKGIQRQFLLDWRFLINDTTKLSRKYFIDHKIDNKKIGNVGIQTIASGPDSRWESIKYAYLKLINSAKKYIYIQSPYFVPDESILQALKIASLSGIDIKVMIPNKPDQILVYWATYYYIGELINSGIRCYKYDNGFIHSKVVIVDDLVSSVGTANMDMRSFNLNFEINCIIYSHEKTIELKNHFHEDLEKSSEITKYIYENRGKYIRFKESIAKLMSPLL